MPRRRGRYEQLAQQMAPQPNAGPGMTPNYLVNMNRSARFGNGPGGFRPPPPQEDNMARRRMMSGPRAENRAQQNYERSQRYDPRTAGGVNRVINAATRGMAPGTVFTPGQPTTRPNPLGPYGWGGADLPAQGQGNFQQGGMMLRPRQPTPETGYPGYFGGPWRPPPQMGPQPPPTDLSPGYRDQLNQARQPGPPLDRANMPSTAWGGYPMSNPMADRNGRWGPDAGERFGPAGNYVGNSFYQGGQGQQGPLPYQRRDLSQPPDRNRYLQGGGQPNPPQAPAQQAQRTGQGAGASQPQGQSQGAVSIPDDIGLPVSPGYIAALRGLEDELAQTLTSVGVERAQIPAMVEQLKQRLLTDQGLENDQIDEALNERGLYHSGIRTRNRNRAAIPYQRRWQDISQSAAQQYGQLSQQELQAREAYRRGRLNALMGTAADFYENPTSAIRQTNEDYYEPGSTDRYWDDPALPAGGTRTRRRNRSRNRNRRRRNRG